MKTVGLCMIVKDEAGVLHRCLASVAPLVDYAVIQDTGSRDRTADIGRQWLDAAAVPGEVCSEPWSDFATNRTSALARLQGKADYALVMDADDVLVLPEGFDVAAFKAGLTADAYNVGIRLDGLRFARPQLFSCSRNFVYRGVLHEYAVLDGCRVAEAEGLYIRAGTEGARSRNPDRYKDDAGVLARALESETDPFLRSRYTYYLGQSHRDAGNPEQALACFLERAGMGFWDQEVYVALLGAGRAALALGHPDIEVLALWGRASDTCPGRAEALFETARLCNRTGRFAEAVATAGRGLALDPPRDGLFVEEWIYLYGMADEWSVALYGTGHYRESLEACLTLLIGGHLPEGGRDRVAANARHALSRIAAMRGEPGHRSG